jgi:hypothetical protein
MLDADIHRKRLALMRAKISARTALQTLVRRPADAPVTPDMLRQFEPGDLLRVLCPWEAAVKKYLLVASGSHDYVPRSSGATRKFAA